MEEIVTATPYFELHRQYSIDSLNWYLVYVT